ncbi:MAG TPA: DinB family protein [Anaerolineales bacterium]|nr:DinB family protein [Anaerolineales bacterium]
MPETAELAQKLKFEGEKFAAFFGGLTADQWNREVYTEGSVWTIRSILAHLMASERALVGLFESIRQGGAGVPEDFVIDRYNASQQEKTKALTPADLLDQYKAVRAETLTWLSGIPDSDLEKTGRHPFLGITTLREMVKMVYIHNQTHYRDLRRVLKG